MGVELDLRPHLTPETVAKFWSRVNKGSGDACWEWSRRKDDVVNYSKMLIGGQLVAGHRVSWAIHNGGVIPADMFVCHHCDNPRCARPEHLYLGTPSDNARDVYERDRRAPLAAVKSHGRPKAPTDLLPQRVSSDQDWQKSALCAQTDPELFFVEKGSTAKEARAICAKCEVRTECLEWALTNNEQYGVYGGTTETERRRIKRARRAAAA